jgi:Domain of unknown function (DUF4389)
MSDHPVQLEVTIPARTARLHVVTRLVLLVALGVLGTSAVTWAVYLAIPAVVTLVVSQKGGDQYVASASRPIVNVLRWFASAYGYLWMLTDALPTTQGHPVDLHVTPGGHPTMGSALSRLITSLPALLVLAVLSAVAGLLWIVAAVVVLVRERMPAGIARFIAVVLRFQFRLVAYHLSIVDRYPSLQEGTVVHAPA